MLLESHCKGWADFRHEYLKGNNILVGRKSWARTYTNQCSVYSVKSESFDNSLKVVAGKSGQICCPCIKQELVNIFSKGPDSTSGFVIIGLVGSVLRMSLCYSIVKTGIDHAWMNGYGCVPIQLHLSKQTIGESDPQFIVCRPMTPVDLLISPIEIQPRNWYLQMSQIFLSVIKGTSIFQ